MKKILLFLLFLLLPLTLFGQSNLLKMEKPKKPPQYSISLDGSTEYASKTSPTGLDLNLTERITATTDRDFETSAGNWTNNGSYNFARSTATPITGTASLRGVIGSGDATTNNLTLPYTAFTAIEAGKKYTLQFNVRDSSYASGDSIYAKIGDKIKGIAFTDANTKKYVYNFLTSSSTVNQNIIIYCKFASGTRVIKMDDVTLTQKKDILINIWARTTDNTNRGVMVDNHDISLTTVGYSITKAITGDNNGLFVRVSDGPSVLIFSPSTDKSSTITNGAYHLFSFLFNGTGTSQIFLDGVSVGSGDASSLGKIIPVNPFTIGRRSVTSTGLFYNGNIGETSILTFDNISNSNVSTMIPLLYQVGYQGVSSLDVRSIKGGGVSIGTWYKFSGSTSTDMLKDWSGNGNNLTGTNVTQSDDQVRGINLYRR